MTGASPLKLYPNPDFYRGYQDVLDVRSILFTIDLGVKVNPISWLNISYFGVSMRISKNYFAIKDFLDVMLTI